MNTQDLLKSLGYSDSPYYLTGYSLDTHPAYSHSFRLAKKECDLQGVYALHGLHGNSPLGSSVIPIVYVCKVGCEAEAAKVHKKIWNQNIVPFLLIETPKSFRLYCSFKYNTRLKKAEDQSLLWVAKTANQVFSRLNHFSAESINDGTLWSQWGQHVNPTNRVDTRLLKSLKTLSIWLQNNKLQRTSAHALIGKYVYLHYLRDRKILSPNKFSEWGIEKDTVFGRNATLDGFYNVIERLDNWLNGSIFPIPEEGHLAPKREHIEKVASTFSGDDPKSGQMHLDFKAFNFSHIPIETLSNVYQQFLHSEGKGREQGAYYTPMHLVNFVLDELDKKSLLKKGKTVFDPACGSGAFLVQCYRRIVEREIANDPIKTVSPFKLSSLLTDHIFGIDVDEDACGITELSLILTLLDYVDPPDLGKPEYSKFLLPPLRGRNIFCCHGGFFKPDIKWEEYRPIEGFDWIVGNPPWKNISRDKLEKGDKETLDWISENGSKYPVSRLQIAEAFSWEVSKYANSKTMIGLLMPALSLFKTAAQKYRETFFKTMDVWSIVNFSNLRHLLFQGAHSPTAAFFYSCLKENQRTTSRIITYAPFAVNQLTRYDADLKRKKKLWTIIVNADDIREIPVFEAQSGSSLPWKCAMWGTPRDKRLITSIARQFPALREFKKAHKLKIHEGLQLRSEDDEDRTDEIIKEVVGRNKIDITELHGLQCIFSIPKNALKKITKENAYGRKGRVDTPLTICRPPHIFVDAARKFSVFSNDFFVIPPRQIGISGDARQKSLLKALNLYLNSNFVSYHQFITSTYFGIERDRPDKKDLEKLPIPIDELSKNELMDWVSLHDELANKEPIDLSQQCGSLFEEPSIENKEIEKLIKQLNDKVYGLLSINENERWLIEDLLNVRMKLMEGALAKQAIDAAQESNFYNYANVLKRELDDYLGDDQMGYHQVSVYYTGQTAIIKIEHPETPVTEPTRVVKIDDNAISSEIQRLESNLKSIQSQWVYFNRNLKIFDGRTTYYVKPNRRLSWLRSQALHDADEFIAEKLI